MSGCTERYPLENPGGPCVLEGVHRWHEDERGNWWREVVEEDPMAAARDAMQRDLDRD